MPNSRPDDFEEYWRATLDELESYPASPEIDLLPIRCTDFADTYEVRLTSVGPYRLYGYLSIPKGEGPFPAIYYAPKYQSVLELIPQGSPNQLRRRFIVFSPAGRGQRNSDKPYSAMFPGQLTDFIDKPEGYVFRGIAADSVRGLEFLLSRSELDKSRVASIGNDMALVTAALHSGVTHVVCTPALFQNTAELATRANSYPLQEINDYLHLYPERKDAVEKSLSYMDLRWFADNVNSTTLIMADASGGVLDAGSLEAMTGAIAGSVTVHDSESSSYKDGVYAEEWLAREFGYDKAILPEHWQ